MSSICMLYHAEDGTGEQLMREDKTSVAASRDARGGVRLPVLVSIVRRTRVLGISRRT